MEQPPSRIQTLIGSPPHVAATVEHTAAPLVVGVLHVPPLSVLVYFWMHTPPPPPHGGHVGQISAARFAAPRYLLRELSHDGMRLGRSRQGFGRENLSGSQSMILMVVGGRTRAPAVYRVVVAGRGDPPIGESVRPVYRNRLNENRSSNRDRLEGEFVGVTAGIRDIRR